MPTSHLWHYAFKTPPKLALFITCVRVLAWLRLQILDRDHANTLTIISQLHYRCCRTMGQHR